MIGTLSAWVRLDLYGTEIIIWLGSSYPVNAALCETLYSSTRYGVLILGQLIYVHVWRLVASDLER